MNPIAVGYARGMGVMNKRNALVLVLLASLVLSACGGGASAPMAEVFPQLDSAMGGADVSREAVGAPAEDRKSVV